MTGGRQGGAAGAGTAADDPLLLFGDDFGERRPAPDARRARRRGRRILAAVGLVLLLLLGAAAGTLYLLSENIGDNVQRVPDVFGALDESSRPPQAEALTFLLVGTDSRSAEPTTGTDATGEAFVPGAQRSDVLMIARIEPDRTGASVVSIPRDSWVEIPGARRPSGRRTTSAGTRARISRSGSNGRGSALSGWRWTRPQSGRGSCWMATGSPTWP